jgi:hypothetical protein
MPEISRFLGIVIRMYYRDHAPPHFHAEYGDYEVSIEIESGEATGDFPRRAMTAVREWHELHRDELREDWRLAEEELPLNRIEPLE